MSNVPFSVVDDAGRILASGTCDEEDIDAQACVPPLSLAPDGQPAQPAPAASVLRKAYSSATHRFANGRAVRLPKLKPVVTVEMVRAEAALRIEEAMPRWMIDRQVSGGSPIPEAAKAAASAIRVRSAEIEALRPIPEDFRSDIYWQ